MSWVEEVAPTSFKEPKRKVLKVSKVPRVPRGNVKAATKISRESSSTI